MLQVVIQSIKRMCPMNAHLVKCAVNSVLTFYSIHLISYKHPWNQKENFECHKTPCITNLQDMVFWKCCVRHFIRFLIVALCFVLICFKFSVKWSLSDVHVGKRTNIAHHSIWVCKSFSYCYRLVQLICCITCDWFEECPPPYEEEEEDLK